MVSDYRPLSGSPAGRASRTSVVNYYQKKIEKEYEPMPKIKTKRSAAKRFKLTANNKVKREKANAGHILTKKSNKRKRNLRKATLVAKDNLKRVRQMIQK